MAELSPATQAVLDAFRSSHTGQGCLAAALRAVADQVVPHEPTEARYFTNEAIRLNRQFIRQEFLRIAAELKGQA